MSQTETGKHLFEHITEEGRLSFDELLLENGRNILWDLQSLKGSTSATSSVTGTLSCSWSLKGEVSAVSSVSGTLTGGWALKGTISVTSSVQGILSHAAPERGFYYAKLGSTILTSIEKDSFRITEELNKIPSFEFEIANCSDNRTTIAAGITDVFTMYRRINGVDVLMFTGIINSDAIEYLSLERIRITGYASYIDLNWRFHQHLNSEDVENVDKVYNYTGSYSDKTTEANNDTINDVPITYSSVNDALYIGQGEQFFGTQIKYSTKGVQAASTTVVWEYSKGSSVWSTLDVLDETRAFTEAVGTHYITIPHKPSDWAKDTVNGVKKFWIRARLSAGSYTTSPALDRIKITNIDVCRVYYFETAANSIMDDVLAGTGYSMDTTDVCPADEISIVAEYETKLRLIAGVANALTWDDSGDKKAYQWWIDTSKKVHFKQKRGATLGDITAELTILNNIEDYFNLSNRLHFLGNYDGRFQLRAIIENTASQDTHEIRELAVPEERYNNYIPLKEAAQKAMTYTKAPLQKIAATVTTKYWLDNSFEVGDTVTLHKDTWNVDETAFQIVRADIGARVTNLDMGISQEHLDALKAGLQRQLDISGIRMHGSTSLLQFGPETSNYQRVDTTTVYPSRLKIEIPSDVRYIHKVLLSWTIGPYHADVTPDTSETLGHDHTGYTGAGGAFTPDVLDGGAHTPTELSKAHSHDLDGTLQIPHASNIRWFPVATAQYESAVQALNHHHTNPTTGAGSSHSHGGGGNTGWESAHTHTNPTTGSESTHTHTGGTTGAGSAHSHGGGGNTGWESAHTHTNPTTGSESAHTHTNPTTSTQSRGHTHSVPATDDADGVTTVVDGVSLGNYCADACGAWLVDQVTYEDVASTNHLHPNTGKNTGGISQSHTHTQGATGAGSAHTHTQGATGTGSAHQHAMGITGTENTHTHTGGTTGAGSAHSHGQGATGTGSAHQHAMGITGTENTHTHTQGNTGDTNPSAYIDLIEHNVVTAISDYVISIPSQNEDPAHAHTINYVPDHPHTGVAEPAHSDHIVTTEPGESVTVQYGIHEIAAGTTLELLVNSEVVASNYVGAQTDIRIDGYLSTGNNTVEIRPIVGENGKKGSCTVLATGLLFVEAKK